MRVFSVPADFRTSTIDALCELNSRFDSARVEETYGQATVGVMRSSGRNPRGIQAVDLKSLERYVAYSVGKGIDFNYTLNASCLGNMEFTSRGIRQINRFLSRLWSIGIRNLTLTLPSVMSIVQDSPHPFTVKISTICQINCAAKAEFYKNQGFSRLVVDEDITRDFRRIRQICEVFGDGVEIIVNSFCIKDCAYKMFHYNYESHYNFARQDIRNYFEQRCMVQRAGRWSSPVRLNWIRPEDLGYYEDVGVHRFKIQGRNSVARGDLPRATEAYMRGSYEGNFHNLLALFDPRKTDAPYRPYIDNRKLDGFIDRFVHNPELCIGNCGACSYCDSFAEAAMDREKVEAMCREVLQTCAEGEPYEVLRKRSASWKLAHRMARRAFGLIHRNV